MKILPLKVLGFRYALAFHTDPFEPKVEQPNPFTIDYNSPGEIIFAGYGEEDSEAVHKNAKDFENRLNEAFGGPVKSYYSLSNFTKGLKESLGKKNTKFLLFYGHATSGTSPEDRGRVRKKRESRKYELHIRDIIRIRKGNDKEDYQISDKGTINPVAMGEFKAEGKTWKNFQEELKKTYDQRGEYADISREELDPVEQRSWSGPCLKFSNYEYLRPPEIDVLAGKGRLEAKPIVILDACERAAPLAAVRWTTMGLSAQ